MRKANGYCAALQRSLGWQQLAVHGKAPFAIKYLSGIQRAFRGRNRVTYECLSGTGWFVQQRRRENRYVKF